MFLTGVLVNVCPADPAVVTYFRGLVVKIIRDWGYDGLKLDGQHMNGRAAVLQPGASSCAAGRFGGGRAGILQDDL